MSGPLDALTINTPLDFAHALENAEQWPQTADNDAVLVAWQQGEGEPGWSYHNPFNTSQRESGDGGPGVAGVTKFTSWAQGVQGTVDALMSGSGQWYQAIINDLAQGAPASQTAHDIEASRWASGHYGATPPNFSGGNLERIVGTPGWTPANVTAPTSSSTSSSPSGGYWLTDPIGVLTTSFRGVLVKGTLIAAGGVLVVLGLWRMAPPAARQTVTQTAGTAAQAAAA